MILSLSLGTFTVLPAQASNGEVLSLANFSVPESLGRVKERFEGTTPAWVIQIQDVHGHPLAQENISAILEHLQTIYGVNTVGVEGSWYATDLPNSRTLPNSREKQNLARALLEEGYLTGPGYAVLFAQEPLMLKGIEDETLYVKNREAFLKHLSLQSALDEKLGKLQSSLEEKKQSVYSPELLEFDRALRGFHEKSDIQPLIQALLQGAQNQLISLSDLSQVVLFGQILALGAQVHPEKLEVEIARLQQNVTRRDLHFEEMLRGGLLDEKKLQYYPEVLKWRDLLRLQDQIVYEKLFDELQEASERMKQTLMRSPEEQNLDEESENFYLSKKILQLKASPKDASRFQENQMLLEEALREQALGEALDSAKSFYEAASVRDQVFFKKLQAAAQSGKSLAVVTGGFHTDGLSALLRKAGISYLVITPDLAGESPDEAIYEKQMLYDLPSTQTLQQPLDFMVPDLPSRPSFDHRFPKVVSQLEAHQITDLRKAVALLLPSTRVLKTPAMTSVRAGKDFLSLSDQEQSDLLSALFTESPAYPENRFYLVTGETIQRLVQTPEGRKAWEHLSSNRKNTILLVVDSVVQTPAEVLGIRAKVDRFVTSSLQEAISEPRFERDYGADIQNSLASIAREDEEIQDRRILSVPANPLAPLVAELLLMSPDLKASFMLNPRRVFEVLAEKLMQLEGVQAFLKSA